MSASSLVVLLWSDLFSIALSCVASISSTCPIWNCSSLVSVCVYPCLSFVVVAWLIVRVGEGGGWNGGWVLNLSLGGGFEFLNFFESTALRRP